MPGVRLHLCCYSPTKLRLLLTREKWNPFLIDFRQVFFLGKTYLDRDPLLKSDILSSVLRGCDR